MKKMMPVLAVLALAVGCGPGPGKTPEATAEAFSKVKLEEQPRDFDRMIERTEWELDCLEKEMEWFADKGELRKQIDNERARLEYMADHKGEILDSAQFDIIDLKQPDANNANWKEVTVKLWQLDVDDEGYKKFKMEYKGRPRPMSLVLIDGKWKIKNKK
jgi:hypothetical protein